MKLLGDCIAVERLELNSIIELVNHKQHVGKVVAVGPGRHYELNGKECYQKTTLEVGDCIYFSFRAGMEQEVEGKKVLFMHERDVLCVVDSDAVGLTESAEDDNCEVVGAINVA